MLGGVPRTGHKGWLSVGEGLPLLPKLHPPQPLPAEGGAARTQPRTQPRTSSVLTRPAPTALRGVASVPPMPGNADFLTKAAVGKGRVDPPRSE